MNISSRIKSLREINNLNQREFAEILGKSIRAVQSWEQGTVEPPIKVVNYIAKVFNSSPVWLLTGVDEKIKHLPSACESNINFYPDVSASAGNGFEVIQEHCEKFNFHEHAYSRMKSSSSRLDVIAVEGDSMVPRFNDKDLLFVDTGEKRLEDGKIYVVRVGNSIRVKQVQEQGNKVLLVSHNPLYRDIVLDISSDEYGDIGIEIVGKVVGAVTFCH